MLNFCDFIQVYVFTTNHHLKKRCKTAVMPIGEYFTSFFGEGSFMTLV